MMESQFVDVPCPSLRLPRLAFLPPLVASEEVGLPMSSNAGQAMAEALMRHRVLHVYRPSHAGKQVTAGWVRRSPGGSRYLLLQRAEEHFYVKRQALGADLEVFLHARKFHAVEDVVIIYTGRHARVTVYRSSWATWERDAFHVDYAGFDEQLQLPVKAMDIWEADK